MTINIILFAFVCHVVFFDDNYIQRQ